MLSVYKDWDIIAAFLTYLQRLCGRNRGWQPSYFVTDDSAAKQHFVRLTFEDLTEDAYVEHFLFRTYSKRTITRNMAVYNIKRPKVTFTQLFIYIIQKQDMKIQFWRQLPLHRIIKRPI